MGAADAAQLLPLSRVSTGVKVGAEPVHQDPVEVTTTGASTAARISTANPPDHGPGDVRTASVLWCLIMNEQDRPGGA